MMIMKLKSFLLLAAAAGITTTYAQTSVKKDITNEDVWLKNTFASKSISGLRPMKDGKHYSSFYTDSVSKQRYILQYEYASGRVSDTILKASELKLNGAIIAMDDYTFNADESMIMIKNEEEPIYRYSTRELNYIWDRRNKSLSALSAGGKQMYASFSPDASKVAFVRDNNIFIKDLKSGAEQQVTSDGKKNEIINGACDWVYEEEFSFQQAFAWSPDGNTIAFYKFDERRVRDYSMPIYGELYPTEETFKYPKAGESNSIVNIYLYQVVSGQTIRADIGTETDQYIPRIKWTEDPAKLCILRMNRHQNKLEYLMTNARSGKSTVILTEESKTYIDINDDLTFLKDGKSFITSSEADGFNHLYLYNMDGKLIRQITKGSWEITKYYGTDAAQKVIYYQSTEASPLRRNIYSIGIDGKSKKNLTTRSGTNTAHFSADLSYFINYHTDANTPLYISLYDHTGKELRVLQGNAKLRGVLDTYRLSKKEFFTITTSENVTLNAWMIKPLDFSPDKKYPVYMFLYGGPGSQQVTDAWGGNNFMWYQLLAAKGYLVVCVDNRGTGGRGAEFKKMTYMDLGKYETIDQIESAKWLAKQSYVDGSRIGIQGWSYGGYMSSLCITKGADVFKTAIAVAPVTNWKYYNTIYTERYLRTPAENKAGYEDNSPINFVSQMKGNFLIVHGTGDDNVHFQNSADMVSAMIKANKKFTSAYYPNKNHGITGGNTRLHLYNMITDYIMNNL